MRAAAARVAFASGATALLPMLETALAKETNRAAAVEMIRPIASQRGLAKSELLLNVAERLRLATTVGVSLVAAHRRAALPYLDRLRALDPQFPLAQFLQLVTRTGGLAVLGPLTAKALREIDDVYWQAYLETARVNKLQVDQGFILFGMTTEHSRIRQETYWHLLLHLVSGAELPTAVSDMLSRSIEERGTLKDVGESFVLELIARHLGERKQESAAWIKLRKAERPITTTAHRALTKETSVLVLLTKDERRALHQQLHGDPKAFDKRVESFRKTSRETSGSSSQGEASASSRPALRTVADFPPGFVSDLREITGCHPKKHKGATVADVEFSPNGRPTRVTFLTVTGAQEQCADASRALILSSIRQPDARSSESSRERMVVLHLPDFFSCLEEEHAIDERLLKLGELSTPSGKIEPPKKVKDVNPVYPDSAKPDRVEGFIIFEAIITRTGCVKSIRTVRQGDERLEAAALLAVAQWKYEPALLDGVPVPIVMTVSVNFDLK